MCEFSENRRSDGHTSVMCEKWFSALNFLHISWSNSLQYATGNLWSMPSTDMQQCPGCRLKHELCFSLQPGHYSSLTAPNLQPTANREPNDKFGFSLQPGHYSSLTAPNLQPTANQEWNDQRGNQHYSHELLMMGLVVLETCWAYMKPNKIISGP